MCKNCTDQSKTQNGDLSEDNSLPINCTRNENKSSDGDNGGCQGDNKDEGCVYCRDRKPILNELGDLQIDDSDKTLWFTVQMAADDIYEDHTEINYCPMCGRKL